MHRNHSTSASLAAALAVGALSACNAGPSSTAEHVQTDTLPSGRIHVTNDGVGLWTPETAWTLDEEFRLGSVDTPGPEQFGDISAITVDADGNIYVLDEQALEVRVFTPTGIYSHTIGRGGAGPGEIRDSWGIAVTDDGLLWVADSGNDRYSVFQLDGEFVTSYRREVAGAIYPWNGQVAPEGAYIDWGLTRPEPMSDVQTPIRFTPPDVLDTFPPVVSIPKARSDGGRFSPYNAAMVVLGRDARLWFAMTDDYTVYERTLAGDTVRSFNKPAVPVTRSDREIDSIMADFADQGFQATREAYEGEFRIVPRLLTDNAGHVIVLPHEVGVEEGTAMDVFRDTGEYLGRMTLPQRIEITFPPPHVSRTHVHGIVRDDFDVQYVVRWRIVKP